MPSILGEGPSPKKARFGQSTVRFVFQDSVETDRFDDLRLRRRNPVTGIQYGRPARGRGDGEWQCLHLRSERQHDCAA